MEWLNTRAAAKYLGIPGGTLARWRQRGTGPPYYRLEGMIGYKPSELDAWVQENYCTPSKSK